LLPADDIGGSTTEAETRQRLAEFMTDAPFFDLGTSQTEVRDQLIAMNAEIRTEVPDFIIVRGILRPVSIPGAFRENYLYGFRNNALAIGPISFENLVTHFEEMGLTQNRLDVLRVFASADSETTNAQSSFARLLATHPDARIRNGELAIEFARQAIEESSLPEWRDYDTLASAYAAAGQFDQAIVEQQRALNLIPVSDELVERRLRLYEDRHPYLAAPGEPQFQIGHEKIVNASPKEELLREAAAGSAEAQWNLAVFYIENGVEEADGMVAPGFNWLKMAAINGHPYAPNEVGNCLGVSPCGVEMNLAEAAYWFGIGVEREDPHAYYNLGRYLAMSRGVPRDDERATRLMIKAADAGIDAAAYSAAIRLRDGIGTAYDPELQQHYQAQADLAGYGPAEFLLHDEFFHDSPGGSMIAASLEGLGLSTDESAESLVALADIVISSSDDGTRDFSIEVPSVAWQGHSVTMEFNADAADDMVFNLVRIAAFLGDKSAQSRLAGFYEDGYAVPVSMEEATYWRQRAEQRR
jgi:TPR repeat protein